MEQTYCDDRRGGLWQDHRDERAERAGTIDHGRFIQIARDAQEKLAQQENVVGIGEEMRHQQRQPGVGPADALEDRVGRDLRHLRRQNDRPDQHQKQNALARDAEAREPIGHQGRRKHRADRANDCDGEGIEEQPPESDRRPRFTKVLPVWAKNPDTLERTPAPDPLDRRVGVGRVDERALLAALFDQRPAPDALPGRHLVDIVLLAIIDVRRRPGRPDRLARLDALTAHGRGERVGHRHEIGSREHEREERYRADSEEAAHVAGEIRRSCWRGGGDLFRFKRHGQASSPA